MFGIGSICLKQQSLCLDTVKTLISYVEIFLDVKVSNLVKEIINILGITLRTAGENFIAHFFSL